MIQAIPGFWLEVKGADVHEGDESWVKAQALAVASGSQVVLFSGQIDPKQSGLLFDQRVVVTEEDGQSFLSWVPAPVVVAVSWWQCPWCRCIEPVLDVTHMSCGCWALTTSQGDPVLAALEKAKQARFEHGERGQ